MAQAVQLPDGRYFPIKEGERPEDAYRAAMQLYPDAFEIKQPEPPKPEAEGGFFPALKAGYSALKSDIAGLAGRSGLMDLAEAEKYIAGEKKYQADTFKPTTEGFADAPLTNIKELLGGSLPYMAAPVVAGGAAALAAPASAVAGIGAAGLASLAQFTGSNLSRQVESGGKTLGETDLADAALAAIPQAALDTISLRMIPGLGKILEGAGLKLGKEEIQNFAGEAIKKTAVDYALKTGKTMGIEGLTEAGQQVFERAQAGLSISDPEARQEYFDSFIGGAVLGGVIAPAGRYIERGQAQTRYDIGEAAKQQTAQQEQLKLDALAAAEEEQRKSSPEYFQTLSAEYKAAEQAKNDLIAQKRKIVTGSDTETADRLHNTELSAQLKEMMPKLTELGSEYNRLLKAQPKAEEITETPAIKPNLAVGDTLDNPLGNFTKEELASRAPTVAKYIDTQRKKAGKPALETYSIEDIRNAMPNQLPEAEQADLSSLIAAKTGHTGEITYKPTDVLEVAKQKNIDTTTDGFKDFLRRATGDAEIEQLTQPQLHSAFTALSSLPRFDEPQILPTKRNATDYSKEQYDKAVTALQKLVEKRGKEVVKEGEKPITQPVSIEEANQVIKSKTGLKNDADVQTLFRDANRNGDIDFKGNEVTYRQKGAQAEFNIEEGFAPAEGTGFNVMRNGEMLFATNDEAEATAKAEKLGKNATPAIGQIEKSIAKENATVAESQKALDAMEAEGKFKTPQYTQAAARHAGVVDKANKTIESLNAKKQMLQKPVTVQAAGKPTNRKTFTVKEKGVEEKAFNTREEAEKHALENLPEERLNELSTQTKAPGFANRLKKEQERRKKPVLALPAPKPPAPKGPSPEAQALEQKLLPMLRRFGLGNVALKIQEAMKDEGSYGASVITVALDAANPIRALRHETIHGLKDLGFFTPGQWEVLRNKANNEWIDKYLKQRNVDGGPIQAGEQSRFDAYVDLYDSDIEAIKEEAIADAFADFDVNGAPKGLFSTLLEAMRKFFRALRSALNGAGYETAEDIFGKVERGELSATKAADEAEEKPSMRTAAKGLLNPKILPKYEKIINDVVEEMGLTPEEFASTSLIHQTGKAGVDQFEANKLGGLPEVVQFLQDQRKNSGLPLLDVEKPADRKMIAKLMATEAMAAIRSGGANLEWYDSIINKTLAMAGLKYPELITDINARTAFRIATAITSQGLNVEDNLGFAMKVYDQFRQNKKFPEVGQGADQGAMVNNFKLANYLMNDMGANTLRQFLETEFTVEEMRGAGFNIAGELGDEVVLGSSVFGPKIGFGFYSNLNGNFDPVTMDMWFMRTIGRLTGKLKSFRQDLYDAQLGKFRDGLEIEGSNGVFANQFNQDEIDLAKADDKAAEALARKVKSAHERDYKVNRAGYDDGTREKSKLVAAAETMIKSLDAPKDAPANGSERRNLRDVVRQMVDIVEEKYGKRVPPASLQAVIWYPEQELYKAMGVKLRVTSQNYAGAIEKILKGEGYAESDLSAAAKLRPRTAQQLAKSTVASGTQTTGTEPIRLGALQAGEKEALLERGRKRVVLTEEKETPKRKKLIFEVAPDPNNKALTAKWRALPNQARIKISEKIGNIIIKNALNTFGLKGYVDTQVGSYLDDTNPSFALYLDSGDAVAMTKFLGHALSQDSMMVLSPKPAKGLDKTGAVRINIGNMPANEVDNIYQQLREIEVDGEKPVGGQSYMNGHMVVLNYSNVSTNELASLINDKLDKSYEVITEDVYTAFPEKKDYDYADSSSDPRGNAGVLRQASRNLRTEATRLLQKELREFKPAAADKTTGGTKASLRTAPDTAEFKQWFGDSKIVDADGNPRVMYHGTAQDITAFKPKQAGAIFLTDDPTFAGRFSGDSLEWMSAHADQFLTPTQLKEGRARAIVAIRKDYGKRPQGTEMIDSLKSGDYIDATPEAKEYLRKAYKEMLPSGPSIMPVYIRAEKPFDYDNREHVQAVLDEIRANDEQTADYTYGKGNAPRRRFDYSSVATGRWEDIESAKVQDAIKSLGFDGFYVLETGRKNLAVYEPSQIKSATGNEGTYDINNPDIRKSLRTNVKNDLSTMPNGAAILATMNRVTPPRETKGFAERIMRSLAPESWSYFRQQALDRYNRLSDYDKMIAKQMGGIDLLADQSAHWASLHSDNAAGIAASALGVGDRMGGTPVLKNGYVTIDNFNGTVKGVVEIISPLARHGDPDIYRLYQLWSAAKRGTRLYREGRFDVLSPTEIKDALTLSQKYPEFVTVQQEWTKYNNGLVKLQVDAGVITPAAGAEFMKYSDYIPLYRQMDGQKTLGPSIYQSIGGVKAPKTLTGKGDAPIEDYLETIVRNTQAAIQASMKNVAAQKAVKNGMILGMVVKLPAVSSAPDTITILENGKKVSYQCADRLWVEAVSSLNLPELPFLSILAKPADMLRALVTKDPGFMLANMMRDSVSAYVTSGANIKPVISTVKNFGAAIMNRSPVYQALLNAGAIGGYEFSRDVEAGAEALASDLRKKTGTQSGAEKLFKPFTGVWNMLERGTEASDAATRMAVYEATLKETGNEAEAIRRAVEVLNFNRKGRSAVVRIAAAAIPFLNARVQGLDVFFRAGIRPFYDKNSTAYEKQVQKAMLIRGATIMALSTMYAAAIMGDPDYEKQEQETKDNFWLIPSLGIKIPIPFEVGTLFKTIPERIYRYSYGSDTSKDLGDSMKRALLSTFAFNPVPQAIAPLLEAQYNYSVFTQRPIVGEAMQNIAPEFQVGPSTTKIAEFLGKQTGMSPIMIDHVYKGYTGTMGMYLADVMDSVFTAGSDNPKASQRFEQTPVLKRFLLDPDARGQVSAYYDLKHSVDQTVRTINLLAKQDSPDLDRFVRENESMYGMKNYISVVDKHMQKLNAEAAMIRSTPMPADQKRKMLDEITDAQNELTSEIQLMRKMARP
jgi:hypothetical protein